MKYFKGFGSVILIPLLFNLSVCGPAKSENKKSFPALYKSPVVNELSVDAENAFSMLKHQVAMGSRPSGSAEAIICAEYIVSKVREFGLEPVVDEWTEDTPHGLVTFRNIYVEVAGREDYGNNFLLLGSHYDTKKMSDVPDFVGANDAASSTALLLEIMRVVAAQKSWHGMPLHFAFFDGEEAFVSYSKKDGLYGSRRLAETFRKNGAVRLCRAMILLDMIGDKDLTITLPQNTSRELAQIIFSTAKEQGVKQHISILPTEILDDHVPFARLGIPAVDLIDFQYGKNNKHWHTASDNLDNVSAGSLRITGNLVLSVIQKLQPEK
jgi:glutaminyl-peptide cyclotransferase